MKETYYFSHDGNARNDEKILMLRSEFGWEGYGIYWALIEMMFESTGTCLSHTKIKGIAVSYNIDITLLQGVINTGITEELFVSDGEQFWSESLRRRKGKFQEIRTQKSEAGKKGMAKRWALGNTDITPLKQCNNTDITKDNKGKEIKPKEIKEKEIIMTPDEFEFITELEQISNYPIDRGKDLAMYKELQKNCKDVDLVAAVKDWKIHKISEPLAAKSNARSQLNTWCNNAQSWGKNKKQDNPKESSYAERQRELKRSLFGDKEVS